MKKRRPQAMTSEENLSWIMNNELETVPDDFEKDCWVAQNSRCLGKDGRPLYYWKGQMALMYRLTYCQWNNMELAEWPQELPHARHLCNNPRCINPLHIEPGTSVENELDKTELTYVKSALPNTPALSSTCQKIDFWIENHTKSTDTGCKIFLGSIGSDGYGRRNVKINGAKKKIAVHRLVLCSKLAASEKELWSLYESSDVVRHKCHERNCINPEHLEFGTREENARDSRKYSKATKITEKDARDIIEDFLSIPKWPYGSKEAFKQKWAKKLNVSKDVAANIVFRKIHWKDLLIEYDLL